MSYVDAGYAIALSVLTGYGGVLLLRQRRLARSAALAGPAEGTGTGREPAATALAGPVLAPSASTTTTAPPPADAP